MSDDESEITVLDHARGRSLLDQFREGDPYAALGRSLDPTEDPGWPVRGLPTAFPQMSELLDGYRNGLYVYAGGARMGKSTFVLQHAYDLVRLHEDALLLYVGLDQPVRDVQLRLVAMAGRCKIDYLLNPAREEEEGYEKKKRKGLERVGRIRDRLIVVDESHGALDLSTVQSMVRALREDHDGPLFLVLDPLFKLRCRHVPFAAPLDNRIGYLAAELRTLAMKERVGIFCTTRLDRGSGDRRPELADLEEQSSILYEADCLFLLYCDAANDANTPFLEWEWGTDDMMVPIYEVLVAKNKMGPFSSRLFYRFYQSFSMFKECSVLEVDNFNKMLSNLRTHSPEGPESKEPQLPTVEDVSAT